MKLKILICTLLAISVIVSVCSCKEGPLDYVEKALTDYIDNLGKYRENGVTYELHYDDDEKFYYIGHISSTGDNSPLYIPDEINGIPVTGLGHSALMANYYLTISGVEKIYFPWSITYSPTENITYTTETKYIISASTATLIDEFDQREIFVVPNVLYDSKNVKKSYNYHCIIPANITYKFNFDFSSNNDYFFVDLIEEDSVLTKPPYDPKREGYEFAGWYKEAECINEWDFENDIVTIEYDENGERIYEEICLYAKWIEN